MSPAPVGSTSCTASPGASVRPCRSKPRRPLRAALQHDLANPGLQQKGDRRRLVGRVGKRQQFLPGGQEKVGAGQHRPQRAADRRVAQHLLAHVRVEGDRAATPAHVGHRRRDPGGHGGGGQRRAHDVQMRRAPQHRRGGGRRADPAAGAVADVEHEVARAVRAIADEGAAGHRVRQHRDGGDVDAVRRSRSRLSVAEIVIADRRDDGGGMAQPADLVDEDGRRAAGNGPISVCVSRKPSPVVAGHDLDQDLADGDDHASTRLAAPTSPALAPRAAGRIGTSR